MTIPTPPIASAGDTSGHARIEALQTLPRRTVDAKAGFEAMSNRAEREFEAVVRKFHGERHPHPERISAIIVAHRGEPDVDGTVMSSINRAVVSVRAIFDEVDGDMLDRVRRGEGHVLAAFDEAVGATDEGRDRDEVLSMKSELETLLDETSHLD